jgi:hypothetical protein
VTIPSVLVALWAIARAPIIAVVATFPRAPTSQTPVLTRSSSGVATGRLSVRFPVAAAIQFLVIQLL